MRIDEEKKLSWPIQKLKRFPDRQVVISGYTDQIGSDKYNLALSCRRAETVKAYFIEQGISADRITTECKGKAEPRVTCCQVELATTQRRAEIKIESRSNLF